MRRIAVAWSAAVVLAIVFVALGLEATRGATLSVDQTAMLAIHGWTSVSLTTVMRAWTELGSGYVVIPLGVVQAAVYWRRGARLSALALVIAIVTAPVVVEGAKLAFARPRPEVFVPLTVEQGFSYPSGHATMATVAYGFSACLAVPRLHARRWRALVALATPTVVVLVCLSRVYLGVHYPSDVAGGILLGSAWIATWYGILQLACRHDRSIGRAE
jgi:undecaprenyl-diphosphatase